MLEEIEESKRRKEEEKQRARLLAKARREGINVEDVDQTAAAAEDDEDIDISDDDDDAMDEVRALTLHQKDYELTMFRMMQTPWPHSSPQHAPAPRTLMV